MPPSKHMALLPKVRGMSGGRSATLEFLVLEGQVADPSTLLLNWVL